MKTITIGRESNNDVVINDPCVGRKHCQIIMNNDGNMRLIDLNSKNGVFVNGKRISGEVSINKNDIVRIGNTTLPLPGMEIKTAEPPYMPQNNRAGKTGIEITTGFFPLAFLLLLCSPVVEFNGQPFRSSWGTRFFNLPEGEYNVNIYVPYLFWRRCGENSINVKVIAGQTAKVSFRAPSTVFSKGKIKIL